VGEKVWTEVGVATNEGDPQHLKNSPADDINIIDDYIGSVVYAHAR
jgi:hypothetical protein